MVDNLVQRHSCAGLAGNAWLRCTWVKILRRKKALRLAAGAVALGVCVGTTPSAMADDLWAATANNAVWSYFGNWNPAVVPVATDTVDIYSGVTVGYNVTAAVNLQAVQIAGGTSFSPAILSLRIGTALQTQNLDLGTSATTAGTGPGEVLQNFGTVSVENTLAVDSTSSYFLGLSASLSGYNEQLAGIFTQSGSSSQQCRQRGHTEQFGKLYSRKHRIFRGRLHHQHRHV